MIPMVDRPGIVDECKYQITGQDGTGQDRTGQEMTKQDKERTQRFTKGLM